MNSIRNKLVLDHFYIHFSPEDLAVLRKLEKKLKRLDHRSVTAGKVSWSGLYLYSNIGSYFEMLSAEEGVHRLAFAFRAWNPSFLDTRKIQQELPKLPWTTGKTLWKKTGKTWFDWLFTETKIASTESEISGWIMHYPGLHEPVFMPPKVPCSIERFTSLEVSMNIQARETLLDMKKWLPGKVVVGKTSAALTFLNRDFGEFKVKIHFHRKDPGAKLIRVEGETLREFKPLDFRCGNYRFKAAGGKFSFSSLNSGN